MTKSSENYYPALDGLRGLAVLLVIAYHYVPVIKFGWIGVDLFFVLSGFLITSKLLDSVSKRNFLRIFYLRRILRIVPLYYTVLIAMFIVFPFMKEQWITGSYRELLGQQLHYWLFTANIYDALHGWPENISVVHFWSLACEMQFYILWPFVILLFYKNKYSLAVILVLLIILAIIFRVFADNFIELHPIYRYVLLSSRIDAFAFGSLAYLTCIYSIKINYKATVIISSLLLMAGFFIAEKWHYADPFVSRYGLTLNAFFWSSLLVCSVKYGKSIFTSMIMGRIGKYSYGMYVFHLPLLILISKIAGKSVSTTLLALGATLLCSILSYHLLESRFLRLKPLI